MERERERGKREKFVLFYWVICKKNNNIKKKKKKKKEREEMLDVLLNKLVK